MSPLLPAGAVLLRLPASGPWWMEELPVLPAGTTATVTVGHPGLLPADPAPARRRGYLIVGSASAARPIGEVVDVLVTEEVRELAPAWWEDLLRRSERAFDLRLGPVQRVLRSELALHAEAHAL